jgi:hypothetical protein
MLAHLFEEFLVERSEEKSSFLVLYGELSGVYDEVVIGRIQFKEGKRGCGKGIGFGLERVFMKVKGKKLKELIENMTKSKSGGSFSQFIETRKEQFIDY